MTTCTSKVVAPSSVLVFQRPDALMRTQLRARHSREISEGPLLAMVVVHVLPTVLVGTAVAPFIYRAISGSPVDLLARDGHGCVMRPVCTHESSHLICGSRTSSPTPPLFVSISDEVLFGSWVRALVPG